MNMITKVYRYFLLAAFGCFFMTGCASKSESSSSESHLVPSELNATDSVPKTDPSNSKKTVNGDYEIKIFRNESPLSGYGYDIYLKGKMYVHQPNIPAIQGNSGFTSEEDARKTAGLVVHKIQNNILPPSVEVKELDSLDVLK